jgi:hypothetical protein
VAEAVRADAGVATVVAAAVAVVVDMVVAEAAAAGARATTDRRAFSRRVGGVVRHADPLCSTRTSGFFSGDGAVMAVD